MAPPTLVAAACMNEAESKALRDVSTKETTVCARRRGWLRCIRIHDSS